MTNIFDVAYYILKSIGGKINFSKLQYLCYYSYVWHYVWNDELLIKNKFYKCDFSIKSKDLFKIYKKKLSYKLIPENLLSSSLNDNQKRSIIQVIEDYGKYDYKLKKEDKNCKLITKEDINVFYGFYET